MKYNISKNKKMNKLKNRKMKSQKGVTLIALVVTIVILIILAAVSINMLIGENGIIAMANKAKKDTEIEEAKAKTELEELSNQMAGYINVGTGGTETLPKTDDTIPYLPSPDFSQVEGDLTTGLVIEDNEGNQYVWVEVPKTIFTTAKSDTDYTNITADLKTYTNTYKSSTDSDIHSGNDASTGLTSTEYTELYQKMLKRVYTNGGFWIGRYEAGIKQTETFRDYGEDYDTEHPTTQTVVSQANAYPYNWVRCSQAQTLASNVNSGNYTSSLMFGVQWDLVLRYLEAKGVATQGELKTDSTTWGNYKNNTYNITGNLAKYSTNSGSSWTLTPYNKTSSGITLLTTGASNTFSKMNIYDVARQCI